MAAVTVIVKVSPSVSSQPPFTWEYSVNGGSFTGTQTFTVEKETSPEIIMSIVADGQPTDTCVFQEHPFSFINENKDSIATPEWLQDLTHIGSSTISFKDVNTRLVTKTFRVLINAVYNGNPIQSPDPTIINVGTDGATLFQFPTKRRPSPAQEIPASSAEVRTTGSRTTAARTPAPGPFGR
jgi:hypothetical protein